jgi:hypothetical protein
LSLVWFGVFCLVLFLAEEYDMYSQNWWESIFMNLTSQSEVNSEQGWRDVDIIFFSWCKGDEWMYKNVHRLTKTKKKGAMWITYSSSVHSQCTLFLRASEGQGLVDVIPVVSSYKAVSSTKI